MSVAACGVGIDHVELLETPTSNGEGRKFNEILQVGGLEGKERSNLVVAI